MEYGLDLLGLARYNRPMVEELAKNWPLGMWLGVFSNTFGNPRQLVKKILESGRCPGVRVQGFWEDDHNFNDYTVRDVEEEVELWSPLAGQFPKVKFQFSPFCEHNLSKPDKFLEAVAKTDIRFTPVNVPYTGGLSRKAINEVHGTKPALRSRYNFSFDGTNAVDSDIAAYRKRHRRCGVFFLWASQFNGRMTTKDTTPREQRRAWPSLEMIESVAYLRNKVGPAKLPKNFLWKSHAEQHNVPPSQRELKPVLIARVRVDEFELRRNGRKFAEMQYYDTFIDGRFRYYLNEWGYKFSARSKNELYELWANGVRYGVLNPAFRHGGFR